MRARSTPATLRTMRDQPRTALMWPTEYEELAEHVIHPTGTGPGCQNPLSPILLHTYCAVIRSMRAASEIECQPLLPFVAKTSFATVASLSYSWASLGSKSCVMILRATGRVRITQPKKTQFCSVCSNSKSNQVECLQEHKYIFEARRQLKV